jgi:hypothetical protein
MCSPGLSTIQARFSDFANGKWKFSQKSFLGENPTILEGKCEFGV